MAYPVEASKQDSPLLKLPSELRNRIYELSLIEAFRYRDVSVIVSDHTIWPPTWSSSALLRTCRAICNEASSMYYSRNTFAIKSARPEYNDVLIGWLSALEEPNRQMLRHIFGDEKPCWKDEILPALKRYYSALRLRAVHIREEVLFVEMRTKYVNCASDIE